MHSCFLKNFLTETLHFSGCWLFLKKSNNEIVVINITPPIEVYPPTNVRKNFFAAKFWQIFKWGGSGEGRNHKIGRTFHLKDSLGVS